MNRKGFSAIVLLFIILVLIIGLLATFFVFKSEKHEQQTNLQSITTTCPDIEAIYAKLATDLGEKAKKWIIINYSRTMLRSS